MNKRVLPDRSRGEVALVVRRQKNPHPTPHATLEKLAEVWYNHFRSKK